MTKLLTRIWRRLFPRPQIIDPLSEAAIKHTGELLVKATADVYGIAEVRTVEFEEAKISRRFLEHDLIKDYEDAHNIAEESKEQRLSKDDMEAFVFSTVAKHLKKDISDIRYDTKIDEQSCIEAELPSLTTHWIIKAAWNHPTFGKNTKWAGDWTVIETVEDLLNYCVIADNKPKGNFFL